MIDSVSGVSGIPQVVALVILAVGFVTILAWSIRSKSHKKS
jgi:flagellar basal body-associated protein FliL